MANQHIDGDLIVDGTITTLKGMNIASIIAKNVRIEGSEFDDSWINVTVAGTGNSYDFQNGWVNYNDTFTPARFRKDTSGNVFIEMMVKNGSDGHVFTLPEGYRPDKQILAQGICNQRFRCRIDIQTDGKVDIKDAYENSWVSFTHYFNVGLGYPVVGPMGPIPNHVWNGTKIKFENPAYFNGDTSEPQWGDEIDLVGQVEFEGTLYDLAWHVCGNPSEPNISYYSGTSNSSNPLRFRKLTNGMVQLEGEILNTSFPIGTGQYIFTLPENWRPDTWNHNFIISTDLDYIYLIGTVNTDGEVLVDINANLTGRSLRFSTAFFNAPGIPTAGPKGDPGDPGAAHDWDVATTYPLGAIALYNHILYKSLVASNVGNQPDTATTSWEIASLSGLDIQFVATDGQFSRTNPDPNATTQLSYSGNFYATRVYNAVYNDYAEKFESDEEAAVSKVYVIKENGMIGLSNKKVDKAVIGVCSDKYAMLLREELKNGIAIGLAGSLEVEMDEEVKAGDLLVSSKNGKACKASLFTKLFRTEAIFGKVVSYNKETKKAFFVIK